MGSGLNAEQAQILTPLLEADAGRPFVVAQVEVSVMIGSVLQPWSSRLTPPGRPRARVLHPCFAATA